MARSVTILLCCLCLNVLAQSGPKTEAADSIVYEEYMTAFGRAYFESDDFDKALATYDLADTAKLAIHDLSNYAMAAFFKQQYQKALDIAQYGLTRRPDYAPLNRLAFFCCTELRQYDAARLYANALFNNTTSAPLFYYDHEYLVKLLTSSPQSEEPGGTSDKARLIESYTYLTTYYLNEKDDTATARQYAEKLLQLDPDNATAKQVLHP